MSTIRKNANAASVVFGLSNIAFTGTIVQTYSKDTDSDKLAVLDNTGETAAVVFSNQKSKITIEGVVNGSPSANPGDSANINGDAAIVDEFALSGENSGWRKFRLTATLYSTALS